MQLVLVLIQIPLAAMVLYLDVLTVAACLWRPKLPHAREQRRFAVLIPAHNEEGHLLRLLESVLAFAYQRDRYDVFVVADNCTDSTAEIGLQAGAIVHERRDETKVGKGYALQWLISRVRDSGSGYDAYVILDADSIASANFLEVMNSHLERGDLAVQSVDTVLNPGDSWTSTISYVALSLFNNLRPRGRDALGFSAGLNGNGMCFATSVMEQFGWEAFSLTEDAEFHRTLARARIRVRYAPAASVLAEQPTSLRQAKSQSLRWERGRIQATLVEGPRILRDGIRHRNRLLLGIFAEYLVPQLSVLTALVAGDLILMALFRAPVPIIVAALLVLGEIVYIVTGLILVRAKPRIYIALAAAPWYVVWKIWTILVAATRSGDSPWERTARASDEAKHSAP